MYAEISPKCWKVLLASCKGTPGSRVGPGVHKRVKSPKVKQQKKQKKQKE